MKIPECLVLQLKELRNGPIRGQSVSYSLKACKALIRHYECLGQNRRRANKHYADYLRYNRLVFKNII